MGQQPPPEGQVVGGQPEPAGSVYAPPEAQYLMPQHPTIQRRDAQAPAPPFVLSPQEEHHLDAVLRAWEGHSKQVRTFECVFTRFEYDPVFTNDPAKPRFVDQGQIKYAAPDRGMFRVDGPRAEHWICDGRAIYEYNSQKRQVIEYRLPPEMQGKAIADGPLPFLFGADAAKLRERYFLRVTGQPARDEIWLEGRPRWQKDAANFRQADLILKNMEPFALQVHSPNGKNRTVYRFENLRVNERDPLHIFRNDPFRATVPLGWQKIVEDVPPPQPAVHPPGPPAMSGQAPTGLR
jgi:TIGR03009 family protein